MILEEGNFIIVVYDIEEGEFKFNSL
jgi:hypothetical protein